MKRIEVRHLFKDISEHSGKEQVVCGWVRTIRVSKTFGFIEINDGSCFKNLQIVFENTLPNFDEISKLNVGSSLQITGVVVETPQAKQPFELKASAIVIEGASTPVIHCKRKGIH